MHSKIQQLDGHIVLVLEPEFAELTGLKPGVEVALSGVDGKLLVEREADAGLNPSFDSAWNKFYARYKDALVELAK